MFCVNFTSRKCLFHIGARVSQCCTLAGTSRRMLPNSQCMYNLALLLRMMVKILAKQKKLMRFSRNNKRD
jgi:hypothetical protein